MHRIKHICMMLCSPPCEFARTHEETAELTASGGFFLSFLLPFMADFEFALTIVSGDGCSRVFISRNLAKLN